MQNNYKFFKISKKTYLCLSQNPLVLVYLLYRKSKPIDIMPETFRQLRKRVKTMLVSIVRLVASRGTATIKLPFAGQLCFQVKRGYKVFDLDRETVTKIFRDDVDKEIIKKEIDDGLKASEYGVRPTMIRWNVEKKWYQESYVNSPRLKSSNPAAIISSYYDAIVPCLIKIMTSGDVQCVDLREYTEDISQRFKNKLRKFRPSISETNTIKTFVQSTIEVLQNKKNCQIYLGVSHGDFGHNHVLKTPTGPKIIDWEFMDTRSILFDFYNCFFVQLYLNRPIPNFSTEVHNALVFLRSRVNGKIDDAVFSMCEIYRLVFYVERIYSVVEIPGLQLSTMMKWISVFNNYEKNLL